MSGEPILVARAVTRSFGPTPALRDADLTVQRGEVLAVMGPSGSGKSTLLHCLAGILRPDSGEVWFGGQRLDLLGERGRSQLRRDRFGFVFQFGQLVPELPAAENVALPLLLAGHRRAQAMAEAGGWFEPLDIAGLDSGAPASCRAGRRSASRWPAPWSPRPTCCSLTSRPARWTRWRGSGSWTCWSTRPARAAPPWCW
jgi:putative ABC transport system ATP-binding protein